jgi:Holliday junction resolvase RusA-like endonuclease
MSNWTTETLVNHPNFGKLVLQKSSARREEIPVAVSTANLGRRADLRIVFKGQVRGGKNNIIITRTGRRFPNKEWAKWRDEAVRSVLSQLPKGFQTITEPVSVRLDYVAGDKRRRDFPAICDAIWHVLEKAGVVADDTLLWPTQSSRNYDKISPRCEITIKEAV